MSASVKRWLEAQQGERQSRSFQQETLPKKDALRRLDQYWHVKEEFIEQKKVLAVGGGNGIVHGLPMTSEAYSIDPLNPEFPFDRSTSSAAVLGGAGEALPFLDEYFDLVISFNVIDHTMNPNKVADEIYRVLKPGGILLLGVNYKPLPRLIRWLLSRSPTEQPHPHHFSKKSIKRLLQQTGFEINVTYDEKHQNFIPRFSDHKLEYAYLKLKRERRIALKAYKQAD